MKKIIIHGEKSIKRDFALFFAESYLNFETEVIMKKVLALSLLFLYVAGSLLIAADETNLKDKGPQPWTTDIEELTLENENFRTTKWTGEHLQMTLMSIEPGSEIGGEKHPENDQFIRIEKGSARVLIGASEEDIVLDETVTDDWAVFIPAGTWHNLINSGEEKVKLYSIYSPPEHPLGTVHETFEQSEAEHHHHH